MYTRGLLRRDRSKAPLSWATQPHDTADPVPFGGQAGIKRPRGSAVACCYPSTPTRSSRTRCVPRTGSTLAEHMPRGRRAVVTLQPGGRRQPARLDPHTSHRGRDREHRARQQDDPFPYPKLCTANLQVDQAAGYIAARWRRPGPRACPRSRWVFPLSGPTPTTTGTSRTGRAAPLPRYQAGRRGRTGAGRGRRRRPRRGGPLLVLPGRGPDGGGRARSAPLDDPGRPLTLTGGLTFGGGPGNDYTSHGIARCVEALRDAPARSDS